MAPAGGIRAPLGTCFSLLGITVEFLHLLLSLLTLLSQTNNTPMLSV